MDLSEVKDLTQLKALAYDEMTRLEVAQTNLRLIKQRIAQLQTPTPAKKQKASTRNK